MYYVEEGLIRIINNILNEVKEKEPEIKFKNEGNEEEKIYLKILNNITRDQSYIAIEYAMINSLWMSKFFGFTQNEVKMLCKKLIDNEKIDSNNNKHKNQSNHKSESKRQKLNNELNDKKEIACKELVNNKKERKMVKYLNSTQQDIIRLKSRKSVKIKINTYQNDMTTFNCKDDVLTMLVRIGYLSYNAKTKKVFILNEEKKVAKLKEEFHDEACNKNYNSESTLKYAILLGY
ncbi:hypothetical protein U3516DRAFT_737237 [Neocallimastix sp. 'constans']